MKRRGYKGKGEERWSPEHLYRRAHSMDRESLRSKMGPTQIDVIKTYSAAARGFEDRGDFYKAREVLEESAKYLGNPKGFTATDPKLVRKINDKLDEINKRLPLKRRGKLERRLGFASLSIISFAIALFFISFSLTGYAVGELTQENSRLIGTSLFILGLVFTFFYFKNKK